MTICPTCGHNWDHNYTKLVKDYLSGLTLERVGKKHECSLETVHHALIVNNIPRRRRGPGDPMREAARNAKILKRRAAGETLKQIGRRFGLTPERVRQIVKDYESKT